MNEQTPNSKAVEELAVLHYNLTHDLGEKHGTPWVKASEDERGKSRRWAWFHLQSTIEPSIRFQLLTELAEELEGKAELERTEAAMCAPPGKREVWEVVEEAYRKAADRCRELAAKEESDA